MSDQLAHARRLYERRRYDEALDALQTVPTLSADALVLKGALQSGVPPVTKSHSLLRVQGVFTMPKAIIQTPSSNTIRR